jgi:flagellar hook-associated protein 1
MSTFSGLSTALTSLHAQRRGMEVVSQNIANANTEGYSRQRADLQAIGGPVIPGLHARAVDVGSGVTVDQVHRIRDAFLDNRGRIEHAQAEYLSGQKQTLGRIEETFAEPSDTALQSQFAELWNSFSELSTRPGEPAVRTAVLQRATTVAATLRSSHEAIGSLWDSGREQLTSIVKDVNNIAATVAKLNEAVVATTQAGQPANELADQRDLLVMKLSELTGARAVARDDGSVDVHIGGSSLVYGGSVRLLKDGGATLMSQQGTNPVVLKWVDNDSAATPPSGKLASVLESLNTTLPTYAGRLDDIASALADKVNTQHVLGFDRNGVAGKPFFTGNTAELISVAITDPDEVAAASTTGLAPDGVTVIGTLDGANADKLADLATDDDGPDRKYRKLVVDLGVAAQTVNRRSSIQGAVVDEVDQARMGQAGVNLDEEMTNMVAFERAYQAAAKVISTIDQMLDTLINRMGG